MSQNKDKTRNERQQKRLGALNEIARAAGYKSWSSYETAVINKIVGIVANPVLEYAYMPPGRP